MPVPPSSVSDLDGTNGFTLFGEEQGDGAGAGVAANADINGDGFSDLMIGAPWAGDGGTRYILLGKAGGFGATVDLGDIAAGQGGFAIVGEGGVGQSAASAGDVNGDGRDDLIFRAGGAVYVMFSETSGSGAVDLDAIAAGRGGFKIIGETEDDGSRNLSGAAIAPLGDFNGDGFGDLILGTTTWMRDPTEPTAAGAAYVIFGKADSSGTVDLDAVVAGQGGFRLAGVIEDFAGASVSSAGDVNGDGFDDAFVGAPGAAIDSGTGFVVFGRAEGPASGGLRELATGESGFRIIAQSGPSLYDQVGRSVASAGDVNGDGFDDLIIGAPAFSIPDTDVAGAVYVVFGKAGGFGAVRLDDIAAGVGGFRLLGNGRNFIGRSLFPAGDVNGDGFDDIAIDSTYHPPEGPQATATYVIFGRADGFTSSDLEEAVAGGNGLRFIGFGGAGPVGDINGDGFDDLVFGDPGADAGTGAVHVIFGGDFSTGETLVGTEGADRLAGGSGDDLLRGLGGNDTLTGGPGDDTIQGAGDHDRLEGGTGLDLLRGDSGNDTLMGGDDNDRLVGGGGNDRLEGGGGADDLRGESGNDVLLGGGAGDRLHGGSGNDTVAGASGNDTLLGGSGDDMLNGAAGNDTADYSGISQDIAVRLSTGTATGEGSDRLISIETVLGGSGDDAIIGNAAANLLAGDSGDDTLEGGRNTDTLRGGAGNDSLLGARHDDLLEGGDGDDTLAGGLDDDRMTGGPGADIFAFRSPSDGEDTIADWGDGRDGIDLSELLGSGSYGPSDIILDEATNPGATLVRVAGTGVSITVPGAHAGDFDLSALDSTGIIWSRAHQGPVVLEQVPAYNWYHGCTPTAVASIFGYWDLHSYSQYFDAEGWDAVRFTWNVQDQISSPEHNRKHDPTPDDPNLPDPPDTSIADFLHTSEGSLGYGWTWNSQIEPGIEGYASLRGHPLDAWTMWFGSLDWGDIVREIDEGLPMVFSVDTNGDGSTDHSVPVIGYDDRGAEGRWYGAYTTWSEDETIRWSEFRPTASGNTWGVGSVTFVEEPSADGMPPHASVLDGDALLVCGGFSGSVLDSQLGPATGDVPDSASHWLI